MRIKHKNSRFPQGLYLVAIFKDHILYSVIMRNVFLRETVYDY